MAGGLILFHTPHPFRELPYLRGAVPCGAVAGLFIPLSRCAPAPLSYGSGSVRVVFLPDGYCFSGQRGCFVQCLWKILQCL